MRGSRALRVESHQHAASNGTLLCHFFLPLHASVAKRRTAQGGQGGEIDLGGLSVLLWHVLILPCHNRPFDALLLGVRLLHGRHLPLQVRSMEMYEAAIYEVHVVFAVWNHQFRCCCPHPRVVLCTPWIARDPSGLVQLALFLF